jgi:dTDP-4-dehydrorhamnose reductase
MKILLLGSNGQLGWELTRTCPENIDLLTCDYPKVDFLSFDSIKKCIKTSSPDWIINAAAYTAVDQAENEKEKAFRINHDAVREIALQAKENNIRLAHISTDYVFNGRHFKPWLPEDPTEPESIYGASKLKGEQAAKKILKENALIIRTAWLYSSHGGNFVKTMLKLMREKQSLTIIDEQVGTPTWAKGLAKAVWTSVQKNLAGTYHWTDAGVASWYDFAMAIQEEAIAAGLLEKSIPIAPVSSDQFPTIAQRPFYSILDKHTMWQATELVPVHWRTQLKIMLKELE